MDSDSSPLADRSEELTYRYENDQSVEEGEEEDERTIVAEDDGGASSGMWSVRSVHSLVDSLIRPNRVQYPH